MSIEAKQVYEWVKTGHWSLREFKDWLADLDKQQPSGDKYTSFGFMGGDKFVNEDSLKRNIT